MKKVAFSKPIKSLYETGGVIMTEEILALLTDLKEPFAKFLECANKTTFLDYLPHVISALAVIASMVVVIIQYRKGIVLHQKAELYNTKKEAILEALAFLNTFISWLNIDSGVTPSREETDAIELTVQARTIHNKLCISCDDPKLVELFVDLVVPNVGLDEGYPVFEKLDMFRNMCREELGYKPVNLPADRAYLTVVSTRAINNKHKKSEQLFSMPNSGV